MDDEYKDVDFNDRQEWFKEKQPCPDFQDWLLVNQPFEPRSFGPEPKMSCLLVPKDLAATLQGYIHY